MNQMIQILDGYQYMSETMSMRLVAINGGQPVPCFIKDIDISAAQAFYQEYQFDIEEALVDVIEDEGWNDKGEVWLSALDIKIL